VTAPQLASHWARSVVGLGPRQRAAWHVMLGRGGLVRQPSLCGRLLLTSTLEHGGDAYGNPPSNGHACGHCMRLIAVRKAEFDAYREEAQRAANREVDLSAAQLVWGGAGHEDEYTLHLPADRPISPSSLEALAAALPEYWVSDRGTRVEIVGKPAHVRVHRAVEQVVGRTTATVLPPRGGAR
jgi:hypothetical protein